MEVGVEEQVFDEVDASDDDVEVHGELSSSTDDDDPPWRENAMTSDDDELSRSYEEEFQSKNKVDGNPDLEDNDYSSEGMIGKPRRARSNDEFIDLNRHMNRTSHFVNASRRNRLYCIKSLRIKENLLRY